jgi:hypothetical protein
MRFQSASVGFDMLPGALWECGKWWKCATTRSHSRVGESCLNKIDTDTAVVVYLSLSLHTPTIESTLSGCSAVEVLELGQCIRHNHVRFGLHPELESYR